MPCRRHLRHSHNPLLRQLQAFTLVEVLIAITVSVLFGLAAFATNARLLLILKTQRESTAATMMLQERMETIRSLSFSNVTDSSYLGSNIINNPTTSEGPLGNLSETISVGAYPSDGTNNNTWVRNPTYPTGNQSATNTCLGSSHASNCTGSAATTASNETVVKADITITWTSANGRTRTRDLAAVFGIGNLGQ